MATRRSTQPRRALLPTLHNRGILLAVGLWLPGIAVTPSLAWGQEFLVALDRENRVRFVSDAPLEDFEGTTNRIDGFLFLSGEGLGGVTNLAESEFHFEVDLGSLDTGIGLRNRHMRDNYLETDRWPVASFTGRVTSLRRDDSGTYQATAVGGLAIHGVEKRREIECVVGTDRNDLRVRCAFTVALSDHDVPVPKLMFMKIDEVMELDLDFFLSPATGGEGR